MVGVVEAEVVELSTLGASSGPASVDPDSYPVKAPAKARLLGPLSIFTDNDLLAELRWRLEPRGLEVRVVPAETKAAVLATLPHQMDIEEAIAAATAPVPAPEKTDDKAAKRIRKDNKPDALRDRLGMHLKATGKKVSDFTTSVPEVPYNSLRAWANGSQGLADRYRPVIEAALTAAGAA